MNANKDNQDEFFDAHLRRIGQRLELPAEPSALQRRHWRQPEAPRLANKQAGVWIMRHPLLTTFAGSAIAAAIGVLAFMFVAPSGAKLEAGVILDDLRARLASGFHLTFTDIGDEGVVVDGQVVVLFDEAGDPDATVNADVSALYVDAHIQADETCEDEDIAGLDLDVAIALSDEAQWMYFKMLGINEELLEEEPILNVLSFYAEQGVLLQLGSVWELIRDQIRDSLPAHLGVFGIAGDAVETGIDVRVSGTVDGEGEFDLSTGDAASAGGMHSEFNVDLPTGMFDEEDALNVANLVQDVVFGNASAADLQTLIGHIEHAAQTIELVEREAGLYVLTIADLKVDPDDSDAEMIAALEFEIGYREGQGVAWAEMRHVGRYDGAIHFELAGGKDYSALFDAEQRIEPGVTNVLDLSALAPLIQQALND